MKTEYDVGSKQKINGIFGEDDAYNMFYDNVSVIFRIISFVLFAAFLIFTVSSALASADSFSYDNLEYIVRNFALKLDENRDASRYSINYNPDAGRMYALFGKGLAVSGSSGVSVFSATGRLTCSESVGYKDPVMDASENFVFIYDSGNNDYSVYNSFTDVHSAQTRYPIRGGAIADNGSFAIITSSDSHNSVVEVYNNDFLRAGLISRSGYITSVDINNTHVLLTSADVNDGNDFVSKLTYCAIGADSAEFETVIDGSFPIACSIGDGGCVVVCDNAVYFYTADGSLSGKYNYEFDLIDFSVDNTSALLLFKQGGFDVKYTAVCVDNGGNAVYSKDLSETVTDIKLLGDISYLLADGTLFAFDGEESRSKALDFAGLDSVILPYDDYKVYVCTDTAAPLVTLESD